MPSAAPAAGRPLPLLLALLLSPLLLSLVLLRAPPAAAYLPASLTNFQNEYACDNASVLIVRPQTLGDVQRAVQLHDYIRANGGGWSWNQPFFCAPNKTLAAAAAAAAAGNSSAAAAAPQPPSSANVVMATLRPLVIDVDEEDETVTVDAGIRTWDLLRYLANYVTRTAPSGWTLPAFPWFVFQTLGGAVSTGTHGSSLRHKSLSSQALEVTAVLANGTAATFNDTTHPFLMKAVRLSVGRLGIITHIKFRIVREVPVTRTLRRIPASAYLDLLKEAQAQWRANQTLPGWMDETEWFWVPQRHEFLMVSFTRGDAPDPAVRHAVLSSYEPEETTVYNTSLALLKARNATFQYLPLQSNATFDPTTGLSLPALDFLANFTNTVINQPWQQLVPAAERQPALRQDQDPDTEEAAPSLAVPPAAASEDGGDPGSTRATAVQQQPAVTKQQGPDLDLGRKVNLFKAAFPAPPPPPAAAAAAAASPLPAAPAAVSSTTVAAKGGKGSNSSVAATALSNRTTDVAAGEAWSVPPPMPPMAFYGATNMADAYIDISRAGVYTIAANTTAEASAAYLHQPEDILESNIRKVAFDQYEVAVPVGTMADCWQGLLELLYGSDNIDGTTYRGMSPSSLPAVLANASNDPNITNVRPDYGFRSNPLIRSTGKEDTTLLSNSHDTPVLWLNIEDYLYYNRPPSRHSNAVFKAVYGYLRSDPRCGTAGINGTGGARGHWGKAGWPDPGCFHGDREFPDTWCSFGCAVQHLDPKGKFQGSAPDRWDWSGVDLSNCCGPDGFRQDRAAGCTCAVLHARAAEDCPPSPYYTYR